MTTRLNQPTGLTAELRRVLADKQKHPVVDLMEITFPLIRPEVAHRKGDGSDVALATLRGRAQVINNLAMRIKGVQRQGVGLTAVFQWVAPEPDVEEQFWAACCSPDPDAITSSRHLRRVLQLFCDARNLQPPHKVKVGACLRKHGCDWVQERNKLSINYPCYWRGVRLHEALESDEVVR